MTEPTHRDMPAPPRPGMMTEAEILRNIAIKSSQRRPVDNQGRPTEPPVAITYDYDDYGRITGVTTRPAEDPVNYSAVDVEFSPAMQAMRDKAARNAEAIRQFVDEAKNDPNAHTDYQH